MFTICHYMPLACILSVIIAFTWILGGGDGNALMPVIPWVFAFALEGLLFFPQQRSYEPLYEARARVWRQLKRDPLFYVALVFCVLLFLPVLNIMTVAEGATIATPPFKYLPTAINFTLHYSVIQWFVPTFLIMITTKHSLGRHGKQILLEAMVWNAALLAIVGFIMRGTDATGPLWSKRVISDCFASFGYPNAAGAFFMTMFAFAIGLWRERVNESSVFMESHINLDLSQRSSGTQHPLIRAHYMLIPAVLIFFAALSTFCRTAIIFTSALAVLALVYSVASNFVKRYRAKHLKDIIWLLGLALLFAVLISIFAPQRVAREAESVNTYDSLDRLTGKHSYHTRVAWEITKDYPFFGCGGWGYGFKCMEYMTDAEKHDLQRAGGMNVHCDFLQFLCEHGCVGILLMLIIFIMLLWPVIKGWKKLVKATAFLKAEKRPPHPIVVYAVPPPVVWVLLGDILLIVHSCLDCPLRFASNIATLFVSLAVLPGYFPETEEEEDAE